MLGFAPETVDAVEVPKSLVTHEPYSKQIKDTKTVSHISFSLSTDLKLY